MYLGCDGVGLGDCRRYEIRPPPPGLLFTERSWDAQCGDQPVEYQRCSSTWRRTMVGDWLGDYPARTGCRPIQNLPDLHMPPPASICRGDLPRVELPGDGVEARVTRGLNLSNDQQNVGSELRCLRFACQAHALDRAGGIRRT
jgi:hypothetical protein